MSSLRPQYQLETHEVTNQPSPFEDVNLFTSDIALQEAVARAGAESHKIRLTEFGRMAGSATTAEWAMQANRNTPQLKNFDRYGHRIDEVEFHPSYHLLMHLGISQGVSSAPWTGITAGHTLHAALESMMAQAEPSVCCPMTMTYACVAALKHQPDLLAQWKPLIMSSRYDQSSRPASEKTGVTIGMAMTEKQGGSDVRANTTKATKNADGSYTLVGHKWFCSAPMSDAFLTLAYAAGGLSCYLVPRWRPDGSRNAIYVMRLKDKLGDRANASSEIEYHGAFAQLVGQEGRGVQTIIEMVQHTRLDCTLAAAAYMRQALANALWHTTHRSAFQKKLIEHKLMRQLLADLAIESEAATALGFRVAQSFDESASDERAALFSRIATPVGKYWNNKRVVNFVFEAMEIHGGAGYVEEGVMPRIYRQSPLNSIWEGSGNVICLDVLRAMAREPDSLAAFVEEVESALGSNEVLDAAIDRMKSRIAKADEGQGRLLVEDMALTLQASLLVRFAPPAVADAFCALRLADHRSLVYGAFDAEIDTNAIISRALPQLG